LSSVTSSLFAPGKLIWMGEYAVLDGAPSIVQAVDRGLHLEFATSGAPLTVSSDLWAGPLLLADATADRAETALLAAVVATLTEAGAAVAPLTGRLQLASPELIDAATGLKFGFGSSAAAAAALTVALGRLAGLPGQRLPAIAHAAHLRFQKGAGSGVDVETSLFGGLAAMRRGHSGLAVTPLQLPAGLRVAVLHAGEAANTRTMLATLAAARAAALPGVESALASMAEAAEASVVALAAGNLSDFLTRVASFADAERSLSAAAALPIMSASVERCIEVAARAGWVAKPSGAGGGDIVVAFADGLEPTEALAASAESARIPLLLPGIARAGALGPRPD
jgi:phosphomevalonate kinase